MTNENILPVIWSRLAEKDLATILGYLYENWDINVVTKYIDLIDYLISQISKNPSQYPVINNKAKIRKCVISKHNSLYYRVNENKLEILRMYDNRQDPGNLKF